MSDQQQRLLFIDASPAVFTSPFTRSTRWYFSIIALIAVLCYQALLVHHLLVIPSISPAISESSVLPEQPKIPIDERQQNSQQQKQQQQERPPLLSYSHESDDDGSFPPQVVGLTKASKENAIVYLAQRQRHSTYQHRDSFSLFLKSLRLLYANYLSRGNNAKNVDLYILHTGDFQIPDDYWILYDSLTLDALNNDSNVAVSLKLVNLANSSYWKLPAALEGEDITKWRYQQKQTKRSKTLTFSVGYRHMCRFMSIGIWDFFASKKYVWRLDEDSFIYSPIDYNVFDYMDRYDFVYGYRLCTYELWEIYKEWRAFLSNEANANSTISSITPIRPITPDKKESALYNNFFVARISFFRSASVQSWLKHTDDRQLAYRNRLGDLLVHSAAVFAFSPSHQIHRFLDFTYQHMTTLLVGGIDCPVWGGLQAGYKDEHSEERIQELQTLYANCTKHRVQVLQAKDLSPTYNGLDQEQRQNLTLKGFFAGGVEESEGRGLKSG